LGEILGHLCDYLIGLAGGSWKWDLDCTLDFISGSLIELIRFFIAITSLSREPPIVPSHDPGILSSVLSRIISSIRRKRVVRIHNGHYSTV
jgi:hypothetical protein